MPEISPLLRKIQSRERKSESPIEESVKDSLERLGVQFRQQEPIGPFFADFYLPDANVVLECDGKAFHDPFKDGKRDQYMFERGIKVFRLSGSEINHSPLRTVMRVIGDIQDNSEWSSIIPRVGYGRGNYCDGDDPKCYECKQIRHRLEGKPMEKETYYD